MYFQESLIYKFIYFIFSYLAKAWEDSLIARASRRCGAFFRRIFSGSAAVNWLRREGTVSRAFEGSLVYRLIDWLINLPQRLLHPLYKRAELVLGGSILFKLVLYLAKKLHILTAAFLFVAMVVPHERWNNLYSTAAVVLLLVLYFIRTIAEGRTGLYLKAANVFLFLFLLCVILSEVFSIMPGSSLRFMAFYLTCFLLVLLLMVSIRTKEDMSCVLAIILLGMSASGLYGIYQNFKGVPVNASWIDTTLNQGSMSRVYSTFYNPNNFAEVIVMLLPFYMAAFFNTKGILKKLIYLALAVPPFVSLLWTLSRSAWIAFAIAGLVYVFFKEKRLIPIFLVLGIIAIPFLPQSIVLRLRTITNPADTSTETRLDLYRTVFPILKDYWFTGLGLGNETLLQVSRNYFSFLQNNTSMNAAIPSHSHDLYLQVWFETGFTGILSFLAFLGATIKRSIKAIWDKKDTYTGNILIAGLASLAGILVIGVVEYVWFYQRVMLIFWAVIGMMLAALSIRAREQQGKDTE